MLEGGTGVDGSIGVGSDACVDTKVNPAAADAMILFDGGKRNQT
jgi:hypothetical protein